MVMGIMVTGLGCEEAHPVFIREAKSGVELGVEVREPPGVGREAGVDQVAVAGVAVEAAVVGNRIYSAIGSRPTP
jgi:hypothetical protein